MTTQTLRVHPSTRIAYVGAAILPSSAANAQRMLGVAKSLKLSGAEVVLGSASASALAKENVSDSEWSEFEIVSLSEVADPSWPRIRRVLQGILAGGRTTKWLKNMHPRPHVVILYGTPFGYLFRLRRLTRRLGIPLVLDVVEWYQSEHLPGGRLGPLALANAASMRLLAGRADGMIVISTFLESYFAKTVSPILRVPPLFDMDAGLVRKHRTGGHTLRLCYVGSPGLKDRSTILNLLQLPHTVGSENADRLEIDLVGVSPGELESIASQQEIPIHEGVRAHGRLPSNEAKRVVARADFSVLQRPPARYAEAGFPSKIPESLLLGTPVLANLTSDLRLYLTKTNSVFLDDASLESLVARVRNLLDTGHLFDQDRIARDAISNFSPDSQRESLTLFLQSVISRAKRVPVVRWRSDPSG
jgi:hypothetical protein